MPRRKFGKYNYESVGYKHTKKEAEERVKELRSHGFLARFVKAPPSRYGHPVYIIYRISKSDVSRINYPNAGRGR